MQTVQDASVARLTRDLVAAGFARPRGRPMEPESLSSHPLWRRMRELGSQLWLDTGQIEAAGELWDRSFTALTTNNTLLNKEVQTGIYDQLIRRAAGALHAAIKPPDEDRLVREIAFVLNATHAMRLVELFGADVSVELHTDFAQDIDATIRTARRYHAICPEHFIIKVPLTPAGLVAAGRLGSEGIRVNLTLGFSARQNLLVGLIARPTQCNVFLGRLNQLAADHHLGTGKNVGERAVAASQRIIARLRDSDRVPTRQIAASLRSGTQIGALAGVDVLTMPPKAAREFFDMADSADSAIEPGSLQAGIDGDFEPDWSQDAQPAAWGFDTLWNIPDGLEACARQLIAKGPGHLDGPAVQQALSAAGFGGVLGNWSDEDVRRARQYGKIPKLTAWRNRLETGDIGLDALMTLSGLESFATDQKAMDDRIRGSLG